MNRPFKTIRHLLLLLATAAAALCPGDAWAEEVMYIDDLGMPQTADATKLTSSTTTIETNYDTYYYVTGDVTINGNLTINGSPSNDFHLILCDGASLTVTGKIESWVHFYTHCQSTGSSMGQLTVQSTDDDALESEYFEIFGGKVTVAGAISTSLSGCFRMGQLTAAKFIDSQNDLQIFAGSATDFIQVGEYQVDHITFRDYDFITDETTPLSFGEDTDFYEVSLLNGKKIIPKNIFNLIIDPAITGGTMTADKTKIIENEAFTLTFTPDAGYMLFDASYNNGSRHINSAELATARSTGKWMVTFYHNGGDCNLTATFAIPAATITSGGTTTYFPSLAAAIEAGDGETIDVLRQIDESATNYDHSSNYRDVTIDLHGYDVKFGELHKKGPLTIKSTEAGGKFTAAIIDNADEVSVVGTTLVCTTSLVSITNVTFTNSTATIKDLNNGNNSDHLTLTNSTVTTETGFQWYSDYITLSGGSRLILNGVSYFVGATSNTLSLNIDDTSLMRFIECTINGGGSITEPLSHYLSATDATNLHVDGLTKNNLDLRGKWSLELKNAFSEISAGVPAATVQYFDAVATFNPADPTTFNPSHYVPAGNPGANEITAINNSDGKDHYIIMHIVPHEGNPHDTDDPDYWTDERLLYVMEGASAASRSRGPGISLNLPYLLKADEYDADIDPAVTDMQPRHDGAGWYYYKLPASHCVANGYTKSTLQGLAAPVFDMETVSLAQDLETGVVTLSRTTDSWTAELTYDRLHWPFTGTIDDTDKPKLKKLVMKYGGTALITLDTTPASESASDVAKAAAAQAEITAQITHNYPFGQATLEWNQQQIGSATAFGWFKRYSDDSYFWIDVPFTPLDPTEATYPAGTANNPWLIQNGADLSMLAKCVNIGSWTAHNRYLRQSADIDLAAEGVTDFEPIASTGFLGLGFEGNYDGFGYTISHIDYTCTRLPDLDGTKCFVGLFGQVFGMDDRPGSVKNVTLKDCEFKAAAGSCAVAVGTIAGYLSGHSASAMTISNCKVLGSTEVSGLPANCGTGAIIGHCDFTTESNNSLANNYYGYNVSVTNDGGTATGYTPRGYSHGLVFDADADAWTYEWRDVTDSNGAMLGVKKATLPAANANGSTVAFSQTTTPALADATHPADCYSFSGNDYYYAVDQPVTLSVTTGSVSPDGVRTFYDELSTLTMNDGTADTDIKDALGFTMPGTDVTIEATFTPSDWFTIDTNQKEWMSFYHLWEDTAPANYTVTDLADNSITALTITDVDLKRGAITPGVLDGISYSGMPTLFYCKNGLPEKLKFTPNATASTNVTPWRYFSGVKEDTPMKGYTNVYVLNGIGDFYLADITDTDYTLKAHRCYIAIGNNAGVLPARLHISGGEETGIDSMFNVQYSMFNGQWFTIDGRKLDGKPTQKGIYINGGRKVVIK